MQVLGLVGRVEQRLGAGRRRPRRRRASTTPRSSAPAAVAPGSNVLTTSWPRAASRRRAARPGCDLPTPSPPSKTTKTPARGAHSRVQLPRPSWPTLRRSPAAPAGALPARARTRGPARTPRPALRSAIRSAVVRLGGEILHGPGVSSRGGFGELLEQFVRVGPRQAVRPREPIATGAPPARPRPMPGPASRSRCRPRFDAAGRPRRSTSSVSTSPADAVRPSASFGVRAALDQPLQHGQIALAAQPARPAGRGRRSRRRRCRRRASPGRRRGPRPRPGPARGQALTARPAGPPA